MITVELAKALKDVGLTWKPEIGDRYAYWVPGESIYTIQRSNKGFLIDL